MKKILLIISFILAFTACDKEKGGSELPVGTPVISVSKSQIFNDGIDKATISVHVNDIDVTEHAVIYVSFEGEKHTVLEDYSFYSAKTGTYSFFAYYSDQNSEKIEVKVVAAAVGLPDDPNEASTDFSHKVMILQYTGTACVYCPNMSVPLKDLAKETDFKDKFMVVACHSYNGDSPLYESPLVSKLATAMGVQSYPTLVFDFIPGLSEILTNQGQPSVNKRNIENKLNSKWIDPAEAAIAASSVKNGNTLDVSIGVKSGKTQEYRVGLFLVEDGIVSPQTGDKEEYAEYHLDIHDNAIRATYDGCPIDNSIFTGESLGIIESGKTGEISLSVTLKDEWVSENLRLAIFVTARSESDNNRFITKNIIECGIETKVAYSYNK